MAPGLSKGYPFTRNTRRVRVQKFIPVPDRVWVWVRVQVQTIVPVPIPEIPDLPEVEVDVVI